MDKCKASVTASIIGVLFINSQAMAATNTADINAAAINLRTNCIENGIEITNCFNNLPDLLDWTWGIRTPAANNPLLVNIGPGIFYGKPDDSFFGGSFCRNNGYVTFRGAGQEHTTISASLGNALGGITVATCDSLAFEDLTIDGGNAVYGFLWTGNGSSTYSNVALTSRKLFAWYDGNCTGNDSSEHYFFSSKITSTSDGNAVGYLSSCATTWFYGSEIKAIATKNSDTATSIVSQGGEIHVYGSAIRALADTGVSPANLTAVVATGGGSEIHIHGTGIDVIADTNTDVTALSVDNGGFIHASESSYVMETNGGTKTRIKNVNGNIQAPYLWQGDTPPGITSIHGADMALTTDNTDGQPHIVVYSNTCPSKWFDSTLNQCRP